MINYVLGRETTKDLFKISLNGQEVKNKTSIATELERFVAVS